MYLLTSRDYCKKKLVISTDLTNPESAPDKDKPFGVLLTDLSKLQPYGFESISLKLMLSYLTETKQRAKIGISYNSHRDIVFCVPQESILGPLLFNIFLCDLFLSMKDIDFANYADDNTTYSIR